ncbi:hypothetical protein [Roseibium sp.]|uniref:hypothetical protein n=1 Tax=Roseibium sp. TaxID=1936156 RepID=UPI0039EF8650
MTDESRVATSRLRTPNTPFLFRAAGGAVIGLGVMLVGFFLADWQQGQLEATETRYSQDRAGLIRSLEEARQSAPRSRLEELAGLPLLAESISLSAVQSGSEDARDVGDYIGSALSAAREETDFSRIILQSADGEVLLIAEGNPPAVVASGQTSLEALVFDLEGDNQVAGKLIGFLPAVTAPKLNDVAGSDFRSSRDIPRMTRVFGVLAGALIAGFALVGAFASRRRT